MQHLAVWQPAPPLGLPGLMPGIGRAPLGGNSIPSPPQAVARQCPALELQGRQFWQVQLPKLEVVQGG